MVPRVDKETCPYLPGDGVRARDLERPLPFNKEGGLEPRGPLIS